MLAATAVKEARACADHIAAKFEARPTEGGFGTNAVSFFGMLWASTGKNEQTLQTEGLRLAATTSPRPPSARNHRGLVPEFDAASPEGPLSTRRAKFRRPGDRPRRRRQAHRRDSDRDALRGRRSTTSPSSTLCYAPQTGLLKDPGQHVRPHRRKHLEQPRAIHRTRRTPRAPRGRKARPGRRRPEHA